MVLYNSQRDTGHCMTLLEEVGRYVWFHKKNEHKINKSICLNKNNINHRINHVQNRY